MARFTFITEWIKKNKVLSLIILCLIFLRIFRLPEFAMFLADQGRDAIIIRRIALLQDFPLIGPPSSMGQVYLGPFFYYLVAPFLLLSLFNPVGLAFGVSILSIIGLLFAFHVVSNTINKKTSFIFFLLITFSYQLIWFARFSWNPNLLPVFSFFTLYFFYLSLKTHKVKYAIAYGLFFGFSFQLHHLAAFLIVPFIVLYLIELISQKNKRKVFISPFIALFSFLVVSSPLILFDLRHNFLNFNNLYSLFTQQNALAGGSLSERLLYTNHMFWTSLLQIQYPQIVSLLLTPVFYIFVGYLSYQDKKSGTFVLLHLIHLLSFIFLFSFLSSPRHPHYYGLIYLSGFLTLSYICGFMIKNHVGKIILFILIGLFIGINATNYYFIFGKPNNQIKYAQEIAETMIPYIDNKPYNIATLPTEFTSEDTFRYFLEKKGLKTANREAGEVTEQMYVLCNKEPCDVLHSKSWNIEMFGKAKIDTMWKKYDISIYRLVHDN